MAKLTDGTKLFALAVSGLKSQRHWSSTLFCGQRKGASPSVLAIINSRSRGARLAGCKLCSTQIHDC